MLFNFWQKIINVNVPDPDDARRRRLLNVILVGVSVIAVILFIVSTFVLPDDPNGGNFQFLAPLFILFNYGLYELNRRVSGVLASLIFISFLTIMIVVSDAPEELVAGRSLFFFSVPIVFASVLLKPWMSFGIAIISSLASIVLASLANIEINTFAIGGFLVLAMFSWLSANGIETALSDLRVINRELDERVARRTEELAVANERLKELDKLRSKFVADVSHELRTPVGNLVAYLEMFESKWQDPVRGKRYLEVLQEETSRLQKMVTSVLNLSRIDLGITKEELAELNTNEIAEQVFMAHQTRAETHGLTLYYEPMQNLPPIFADKNQINQVFNNIIGNAVNYTMKGGQVKVKTYQQMDKVVFEVSDTGIGIPTEDIPYLFERFYRGNNAGSSTIAGSGLGLAITKEIVDAYYGTIEVTSVLNEGTTFRVLFPVSQKSAVPVIVN